MNRIKVILLILVLCGLSTPMMSQTAVSLESLLKEIVDRDSKASFPSPEFTNKQFSSYDRATTEKDGKGWFANWDRSMFVRVEKDRARTEYVMFDAQGAGAVVRFWMTFSGKDCGRGTMRIYIDDMTTPAIEGKAFDVLSGDVVVDAESPLANSVSKLTRYEHRGHNLYFPLPYSSRCKITYESDNVSESDFGAKKGSECVYYNINYRTYAPGTKVIAYSAAQMKKNSKLIANVQKQLKESMRPTKRAKLSSIDLSAELASGASKSFTITNTNAIRRIGLQLEAADKEQALRSIVMQISFDGQQTVWVPVGDFFGIGYKQLYTNTWYTSAKEDGQMNAYWVMPFKESCVITLKNYGQQSIKIKNASADYGSWSWDDRSMYFGSSWHQYSDVSTGGYKNMSGEFGGMVDLNFVSLTGKGVYMGDGISLFNTTYGWWGEGDEKVYVDGESFPSHIGTGTEDYYGYAWCRPEKFTDHPFIAQPCGEGSFQPAYTTNTRLRALDGIPFTKSLVFDMELWHWAKGQINYAPVTFWYVLPGGSSNIAPDVAGVETKVALKRGDIMPNRVEMSLEAESMNLISRDGGKFEYQAVYADKWSGGMQIYWKEVKKGARLKMNFESDMPFTGNISAFCTMAKDYGVINIYLNGKLLKSGLNLRDQNLNVQKVDLGIGSLVQGENQFEFEMVDLPDGAQTGCLGVDKFVFNYNRK